MTMISEHHYPRGAWWHLQDIESQKVCLELLRHQPASFAQLRVYTQYDRSTLQRVIRTLESTGILQSKNVRHPYKHLSYTLNPAHTSALISDFGLEI